MNAYRLCNGKCRWSVLSFDHLANNSSFPNVLEILGSRYLHSLIKMVTLPHSQYSERTGTFSIPRRSHGSAARFLFLNITLFLVSDLVALAFASYQMLLGCINRRTSLQHQTIVSYNKFL